MSPIKVRQGAIGTLAALVLGGAAGAVLVNGALGWFAPSLDTEQALLWVLMGLVGGAIAAGFARSKASARVR